jgi:predicted GNAT family N-acyltransferase
VQIEVRTAGVQEMPVCLAIRRAVFVVEQGIDPALDVDGRDAACRHVLALRDGRAVGAARLREADGCAKAERVAVLPEARRLGVGHRLMEALEARAREQGHAALGLSAQLAAVRFYERLGYRGIGERYLEAGIPHWRMEKAL